MLVCLNMVCVGPSSYVGALLHVKSPNATDIKLVLQRESEPTELDFLRTVLPNEERVGVVVRVLFEETGLALHVDD
jgi:hypothetical protein